jgi:hypothetical protein
MKNLKKVFDIVYIEFHNNTSWANGLHIIIREIGECFEICNVTGDGKPELYENGKFKTSFVNKKWKGITKTNLKYIPSKEDCKNNDIKDDTKATEEPQDVVDCGGYH